MQSPRCRVTFFDTAHHMKRTLDVDAALPLAAAEIALRRLEDDHIPPEDLGSTVKVEVITSTEHALPLRAVTQKHLQVVKARVA